MSVCGNNLDFLGHLDKTTSGFPVFWSRVPDWKSTSIKLFRPGFYSTLPDRLRPARLENTEPWFYEFLNDLPKITSQDDDFQMPQSLSSVYDVILYEGIDFNVICAIGIRYRVNPEFFARHLIGARYDGVASYAKERWKKQITKTQGRLCIASDG